MNSYTKNYSATFSTAIIGNVGQCGNRTLKNNSASLFSTSRGKLKTATIALTMSIASFLSNVAMAEPLKPDTIYVNTSDSLYKVDEAAGMATRVADANPSFSQIEDIAFDGSTLYGLTYVMQLFRFDESQNAMEPINNFTSYGLHHHGLEARDGVLYAAELHTLQTVDPTTGKFTDIGPYGLGAGETINDLAFDENGVLYAAVSFGLNYDYLGTLNPSTGELNIIGNTQVSGLRGITVKHGVIYGINSAGDLVTINKTSGAATTIASGLVPGAYGMDTSPAATDSTTNEDVGGGAMSLPLLLLIIGIVWARARFAGSFFHAVPLDQA